MKTTLKRRQYNQLGFWMLAPTAIILIVLTLYPIIYLSFMMFTEIELTGDGAITKFVGLSNFVRMVEDKTFFQSLGTTIIYVISSVSAEMVFGMLLALMVANALKVPGVIKTLLMIPMLIAPVAVGLIWRLMYNPEFGLFNSILRGLGMPGLNWLADKNLALLSIIISDIWQWTPFVYLILLAGLQALPEEPFEAAKVDGAKAGQTFRYITLPLLRPSILVALLFRTMDAFKAYDKFVILTSGGPGNATQVVSLYNYKVSFTFWEMGYGAVLAFVTIMVVNIFNLIVFRGMERLNS